MWEAVELINVLECDGVNLTRAGFEDEDLVREGGDILALSSEESGTGEG